MAKKYVDGFVIAISKENVKEYQKMAKEASGIWRKYGALDYKECVGDDLSPEGVTLPFPKMLKLKDHETAIFAFILFKSRTHRDRVNAKVMKDPFMAKYEGAEMPFDMKRMAFGGFEVIVD